MILQNKARRIASNLDAIYPSCCENDSGIGLLPMANMKMHPIQGEDASMRLELTLPPRFKLVAQHLVEATPALVLGATPIRVWVTCPTLWVLTPPRTSP